MLKKKLIFNWKHWYWYFVLIGNVFSTVFLAILIILIKKNIFKIQDIYSLVFLATSTPALVTCFFVYIFKTFRETYTCKSLIKPQRFKFLHLGLGASFISLNIYFLFWFISYKTENITWIYCALPITMIFGISSTILLTIYEFCISFDVFYHKNKKEIIHDFLQQKSLKK